MKSWRSPISSPAIPYIGCKEHIGADDEGVVKVENVPLKIALPSVLKNKYFYLQALLFLTLYIYVVGAGMSSAYFCNVVLQNSNLIGLCTAVGTWILAFGNYKEGVEAAMQPDSALSAIKFAYGYFGAIISIVCFALILLLNIDKHIKRIQSDLEVKHAG